jgi:hypothetical protein
MSRYAMRLAMVQGVASKATFKSAAIAAALDKTRRAYEIHFKRLCADGNNAVVAHHEARTAYRVAMPAMDSYSGIHAYIACTAQGIQLDIFQGSEGSQLLYAAQVALSVLNHERKSSAKKSTKATQPG